MCSTGKNGESFQDPPFFCGLKHTPAREWLRLFALQDEYRGKP